jgi:hypothetical protein
MYHKLYWVSEQDAVLEDLSSDDLHVVLDRLGDTIIFTKNNPTGFYRLNLGDDDDREVALLLCEVKNVELQRNLAGKQRMATGKSPAQRTDIELVWRNARIKGRHHQYESDRTLPATGFLEVDLVSPVLAPPGARAMDDGVFSELLGEMGLSASPMRAMPRRRSAGADEEEARGKTSAEPWSKRRKQRMWTPYEGANQEVEWEDAEPQIEAEFDAWGEIDHRRLEARRRRQKEERRFVYSSVCSCMRMRLACL